jgi:hypothetical protein
VVDEVLVEMNEVLADGDVDVVLVEVLVEVLVKELDEVLLEVDVGLVEELVE